MWSGLIWHRIGVGDHVGDAAVNEMIVLERMCGNAEPFVFQVAIQKFKDEDI